MSIGAHLRRVEGRHDGWNTPPWVLDLVRLVAPIGLDPCGNATSQVRATEEFRFDLGQDGVWLPWNGHGLVFVNPPWSAMSTWAGKMALEGARGTEVLGLVPVATASRWFWLHLADAPVLLFWRKRLSFWCDGKPVRGNTTDTCSPYWGPHGDAVKQAFAKYCWWR